MSQIRIRIWDEHVVRQVTKKFNQQINNFALVFYCFLNIFLPSLHDPDENS